MHKVMMMLRPRLGRVDELRPVDDELDTVAEERNVVLDRADLVHWLAVRPRDVACCALSAPAGASVALVRALGDEGHLV